MLQATNSDLSSIFGSSSEKESDTEEEKKYPHMIQLLIENAKKNSIGYHGNRFSMNEIMKLSIYLYIRGGRHLYRFFNINLRLPVLKTVTRNMLQYHKKLSEGILYFDELSEMLNINNYPREVCIVEDGTKITEIVEYDADDKVLTGLVTPISNLTGMPRVKNFPATTGLQIIDAIRQNPKAAYVQVILAKPNIAGEFFLETFNSLINGKKFLLLGSAPFVLGFYGTDNRFTSENVTTRTLYIRQELMKRGIHVICSGTDGDSRCLKSQKQLANFGSFQNIGPLILAGCITSPNLASQDSFHIVKKMKNVFFDPCDAIIMGSKIAVIGHLIILLKKFDKNLHNLNLSDLDPTDKLNYQ